MLRAAVIGAGAMGRNHVRVYAEMETVELAAVSDPEESAARRATFAYRAIAYTDYRDMLDRERPDLVSVAVPTKHHAAVATDVICRGIPVLVEKPLASSPAEAEHMISLARLHGVKLTVGHVERFNPAVQQLKQRLVEGELGRLFQLHARRVSPFPLGVQDVGVVLDLATHDIDVMHYVLGARVQRVYAELERKAHQSREDMLSGLMRFEDGVIGVLDVNWLTPTKVRQLLVVGEGGMYVVDYLTQDIVWYKNSRVPGSWDSLAMFRDVLEGDTIKFHVRKREPLLKELEAFVAAVRDDRPVEVTGEDGLAALVVAEALVESGHTHTPVYLRGRSLAYA